MSSMKSGAAFALFIAGLALASTSVTVAGQVPSESWSHAAALERDYPATHDVLIRLERAQGVAFGQLALEGAAVRARGEGRPDFEDDLVGRLTALVGEAGTAESLAAESAAGYAALGRRAAEVIAWANAFYREAVGILVDPTVADRRAALSVAVSRYQSRPEVALPGAPKDMDVLYDHRQALVFRTLYPDLDGLIWAGQWLKLAATEPLTDFPGRDERAAGLDTVTNRYYSKLSYGEPPQFFPSQVPLAPTIAPGVIYLSPESAMIWDNLSMMQEVLSDILASPEVPDVRAALDETVEYFLDPTRRMTERGDWESMALQHGIFFQGGYPLAVMTGNERNTGGHADHLEAEGGPVVMPVMPLN